MKLKVKNIFLAITILAMAIGCLLSCCSSKVSSTDVPKQDTIRDTIYITVNKVDTVADIHAVDSLARCLKQAQDSMKFYRDSISYQNYINARRVAKVNYYIDCVKKNSKNKQFFYGWIKRTMSE